MTKIIRKPEEEMKWEVKVSFTVLFISLVKQTV